MLAQCPAQCHLASLAHIGLQRGWRSPAGWGLPGGPVQEQTPGGRKRLKEESEGAGSPVQ